MSVITLARAESRKILTVRSTWILAGVTIFATWAMAWMNAASYGLSSDDPRLVSSAPVPLEFRGFEMAGFGYVFIIVIGALWAASEFGPGRQIRTTLATTPARSRVFWVKAAVLSAVLALVSFLTMGGAIVLTHAASDDGLNPWLLSPAIWAHVGGLTLAWTLTGLIAFALGILARTAILPLILLLPLVIGIGDFLVGLWRGAAFLPIVAGAATYSDPSAGIYLAPVVGGIVQGLWAAALLAVASIMFLRRDVG
ncbi:hypothetical protein [Microbacterium paulum]